MVKHCWLLVMPAAALALGACSKPKVDCAKFCDREAQCVGEISVQLDVLTADKLKDLDDEKKKILGDKQRDRCQKSCSDPQKPSAIDEKWIKCLEQADCTKFAQCVYDKK